MRDPAKPDLRIGLAGLGTVGIGVVKIVQRHADLIAELRELGCGVVLIGDGDVAGVIAVTEPSGAMVTDCAPAGIWIGGCKA